MVSAKNENKNIQILKHIRFVPGGHKVTTAFRISNQNIENIVPSRHKEAAFRKERKETVGSGIAALLFHFN